MSSEPSYPKDAPVGEASKQNETLNVALTAKEAEKEAKNGGGNRNRKLVTGAAIGVGSAAVVAALMYANRSRKPDRS